MKLADALENRANNIDLLRLLAALMVIYGHSSLISNHSGFDVVSWLTNGTDYAGSLAIKFFFFASGLVVTNSLYKSQGPFGWAVSRLFRIVPAFLILLLITLLILGPMVTTLGMSDYFHAPETYAYGVNNGLSLVRNCCQIYDLSGVFQDNKVATVNGSIWTLPSEMYCYGFVFALAILGCFRLPNWAFAILLVVYVTIATLFPEHLGVVHSGTARQHLLQCFVAGMVFAVLRDYISLRWDVACVLLVAAVLCSGSRLFEVAYVLAILYGALVLSIWPPFTKLKPKYDVSYGVYLYGWPVQQSVAHFAPSLPLVLHFLVAATISLGLGFASWNLIEDRAIKWGKAIGRFRLFRPSVPSNI